jgi:hypothetical protein
MLTGGCRGCPSVPSALAFVGVAALPVSSSSDHREGVVRVLEPKNNNINYYNYLKIDIFLTSLAIFMSRGDNFEGPKVTLVYCT